MNNQKKQVNNKRANYDAEKGLFVGLTFDRWPKNWKRVKNLWQIFDSEDPVEQLDAVSIAPTEATEVEEEEENIAADADQPNDDLEENEEVEEPKNNEEGENDEEAAKDTDENGLGDAEDEDME